MVQRPPGPVSPTPPGSKSSTRAALIIVVLSLVACIGVPLLLRIFVVEAFQVPGASGAPNVVWYSDTGKPYPLNYSQKTKNTTDSSGKISTAVLSFSATKKVKAGQVEAIVIHDLYPVGRFKL